MNSYRRTWLTAVSGYAHLVVAAGCSILTVKLATQHLSQDEYGLWSLSFAVVGYFLFLDLGVSYSLGRIFARSFANQDDRELGQWIFNCGLVLLAQGLVILFLGFLAEPILVSLLKVPDSWAGLFRELWKIIIFSQAALFPFRIFNGLLHGADRVYQVHFINLGATLLNLALFWLFLWQNLGVRSFAFASLLSSLASALLLFLMAYQGGYLRTLKGCHPERAKIRELFHFSWGIFIAGISAHLVTGGQAMVAARFLSLADVAVLNVSGRLPALIQQAIFALVDSFAPRWRTLYSQGQVGATAKEYGHALVAILRVGIALIAAVLIMNPLFIWWWTQPEYFAGNLANLALGALIFFRALNHSFQIPFVLSMRTHQMAYVIFGGAALEILAYIIGIRLYGIPGMLWGAILVNFALVTPLLYRFSLRELPFIEDLSLRTICFVFPLAVLVAQGIGAGLQRIYPANPDMALGAALLTAGAVLVPVLVWEVQRLRRALQKS